MQVEKAFKGTTEGAEIILRQPGHNCGPGLSTNNRYLLYATYHTKEKTWEVPGCGRSRAIEDAAHDLLFLNGLPDSATTTRLSGEIAHYDNTPEKGYYRIKNIVGAKVRIAGAGESREVYTDQSGVYEIYGLPPGKYTVELDMPVGLGLRFRTPFGPVDHSARAATVELKPASCAGFDFVLSSDTTIGGQVSGASGDVLPDVCIDLVPADRPAVGSFVISDCTDKDGRYELRGIPPGSYLIALNKDAKISGTEPFTTTYYPGVFEKDKAAVVTLGEGSKLENHDIHVPFQLPTTVIEGVLLFSDGSPVSEESIQFKAEGNDINYDRDGRTRTDAQGHFSLKLLQGTVGWLRGYIDAYHGEYSDCPYVDKLLKRKPQGGLEIEAERKKIEVTSSSPSIKLMLPFPFCARNR